MVQTNIYILTYGVKVCEVKILNMEDKCIRCV